MPHFVITYQAKNALIVTTRTQREAVDHLFGRATPKQLVTLVDIIKTALETKELYNADLYYELMELRPDADLCDFVDENMHELIDVLLAIKDANLFYVSSAMII